MTLVTRHIFKYLFTSLAFLTVVLTTGIWLTQSLRFIEIIVNQNISIGNYFSLVGFLIPDLIAIVLPICLLISVLFTYNKLIADHELSIFRSCGLSNWRLSRPALVLAFIMSCFIGFVNIYIVPISYQNLRDMEYRLRNEFSSGFVQDGMFNTLRGVTIYARSRALNGDLDSVFIHSIGQKNTSSPLQKNSFTIIAQRGILVEQAGKKTQLMLMNGTRQEKNPQTGQVTFLHFKTLNYDLDQFATNIQKRIIKPYERSLTELFNPPDADILSTHTKAQLHSEGHQRLLPPFLIVLFTLIGLAALLPQKLNRRGRKKYILSAIFIAISAHISLIILININDRWNMTIPFAYGLIFVMSGVAIFMLEYQSIRSWWRQYHYKNSMGT